MLGEGDQCSVRPGPGRAAGVGEQHERQQTRDLAVLGQPGVQCPGQAQCLPGELDALQRCS